MVKRNTPESPVQPSRRRGFLLGRRVWISFGIAVALCAGGYFAPALLSVFPARAGSAETSKTLTRPIQLDVLNGCGAKGVSAKFTNYLRTKGFDVVEMRNYIKFNMTRTLVVDRAGNLEFARKVAAALGVSEDHVVQELNPAYFVDVSVIVGADFESLKLSN